MITVGGRAGGGYRYRLHEKLTAIVAGLGVEVEFVGGMGQDLDSQEAGAPSLALAHEGHSGWTTWMLEDVARGKAVSYRALSPTLSELRADVVLLMAGTNDICLIRPPFDVSTAALPTHPAALPCRAVPRAA